MVISGDRRGLAVLMDALLFLAALSILSALMMAQSGPLVEDGTNGLLRSFHTVMLDGEVPGGDGSSLSHVSLAHFLTMTAQGGSLPTPEELDMMEEAVNGTLEELKGMGQEAWWVVSLNGQEHLFGQPCTDPPRSLYADRRTFSEGAVTCTLYLTG